MTFSRAAVRDLPELVGDNFGIREAVSALEHVGFDASFGQIQLKKIGIGHCPAIAFLHSGEAVIIQKIEIGLKQLKPTLLNCLRSNKHFAYTIYLIKGIISP